MATLRGRQVEILHKHQDTGIAPTYTVKYPDGQIEYVLLSELIVTPQERSTVIEDHMKLLGKVNTNTNTEPKKAK